MKKGILLVANWPSDTGYAWWLMERFWVAICDAYPDRRVLLAYPKVTTLSPSIENSSLEVIELDIDFERPIRTARAVSSLNVDTIYFTDRKYIHAFYGALRAFGIRHILIHDHMPGLRPTPPAIKRAMKWLLTFARPLLADRYLAVSTLVYDRLINVAMLPTQRCRIALNGIDVAAFDAAQRTDIRRELGIPQDTILVVSSSRLSPYKRVDLIIKAAQVAIRSKSDLHFIHCGDGPESESLSKLCNDLAISANFHFLGHRSDVAGILKSADIAVHASAGEGLSLSILEFMCASLPVIVADEPTVSIAIDNGITGKHFTSGDRQSLSNEILALAADKATREGLGRNAHLKVQEIYDLKRTITDILGVFQEALDS